MKASEHLRAALKLLDGTWVNHSPEDGEHCSYTAVRVTHEGRYDPTHSEGYLYLRSMTRSFGSVAAWNDKPGRTFDEVKAAFEAAITAAEKDGN